jgi:hypothetical protein
MRTQVLFEYEHIYSVCSPATEYWEEWEEWEEYEEAAV